MEQIQAQRFYETLALLIARKEGVDIKVTVTPRKEGQYGRKQNREAHSSIQKCEAVRVS